MTTEIAYPNFVTREGTAVKDVLATVNPVTGGVVLSSGSERLNVATDKSAARFVLLGDSLMAAEHGTRTVTAMTRLNGVVTCTAAGHALISNQRMKFTCAMPDSFNGECIITRIDANSFSFPNSGPNESATLSGHPSGGSFVAHILDWYSSSGWFGWLNTLYFSGNLNVVKNMACGGWKASYAASAAGIAYLDAQLNAEPFTDLVVAYGVNDLASRTPLQVAADLQTLCQWGLDHNARVWIDSIKPVTAAHGDSASINKKAPAVNRLMDEYAKATNNVYFVDTFSAMVDPNTGVAIANATTDGIHHSIWAARTKLAPVWYDAIKDIIKTRNPLVRSIYDNYGNNAESPVLYDDAPWANTAGGATAGTVTGDVGVNLQVRESGSGSVAASIAARTDGFGYDQVVVLTAAAANDSVSIRLQNSTLARFVGKTVRAYVAFELTGNTLGNLNGLYVNLLQTSGGASGNCYSGATAASNVLWGTSDDTISGVLTTPPFYIDPAATDITLAAAVMSAAGVGTPPTLKVGRITIVDVG